MTHRIVRKLYSRSAECNDCDKRNDNDKTALAWARNHATKAGHLVFVATEHSVKRRQPA